MEEKIKLIKDNLKGNVEEDIAFLKALYEDEKVIIEDATTTIDAINIVLEEITKEQENVIEEKNEEVAQPEEIEEERTPEQLEIDAKITEVLAHIKEESDDEALKSIEELISKIEALTKNEEGILYCSFKNEFEKMLFERIFAGEKKVVATHYENDVIYIIYADLLMKKKKRTQALEALDRAIYWNFLNREAREKKLDIFFEKKEYVKYLESLKLLQMISYTAEDVASCYNKYGYIFNYLKDPKSAYAMYILSYDYYENEDVANLIQRFYELDPSLKNMTSEEIYKLAQDNEVMIGANTKIIKAQRALVTELINAGLIAEAKIMLENDYSLTREDDIAKIYNQLLELEKSLEENEEEIVEEKIEEDKEAEEKPKKKRTVAKKKTEEKDEKKATTKKKTAKEE